MKKLTRSQSLTDLNKSNKLPIPEETKSTSKKFGSKHVTIKEKDSSLANKKGRKQSYEPTVLPTKKKEVVQHKDQKKDLSFNLIDKLKENQKNLKKNSREYLVCQQKINELTYEKNLPKQKQEKQKQKKLSENINKQSERIFELEEQISSLEEKIAGKGSKEDPKLIFKLKKENDNLNKELINLKNLIKILDGTELDKALNQIKQKKKQVSDNSIQLEKIQQSKLDNINKLEKLNNDLTVAKNEQKHLKVMHDLSIIPLLHREQEYEVSSEIENLQSKNLRLHDENKSLDTQHQKLLHKKSDLIGKLRIAKENENRLFKEKGDLIDKKSSKEIHELSEEIVKLDKQISENTEQIMKNREKMIDNARRIEECKTEQFKQNPRFIGELKGKITEIDELINDPINKDKVNDLKVLKNNLQILMLLIAKGKGNESIHENLMQGKAWLDNQETVNLVIAALRKVNENDSKEIQDIKKGFLDLSIINNSQFSWNNLIPRLKNIQLAVENLGNDVGDLFPLYGLDVDPISETAAASFADSKFFNSAKKLHEQFQKKINDLFNPKNTAKDKQAQANKIYAQYMDDMEQLYLQEAHDRQNKIAENNPVKDLWEADQKPKVLPFIRQYANGKVGNHTIQLDMNSKASFNKVWQIAQKTEKLNLLTTLQRIYGKILNWMKSWSIWFKTKEAHSLYSQLIDLSMKIGESNLQDDTRRERIINRLSELQVILKKEMSLKTADGLNALLSTKQFKEVKKAVSLLTECQTYLKPEKQISTRNEKISMDQSDDIASLINKLEDFGNYIDINEEKKPIDPNKVGLDLLLNDLENKNIGNRDKRDLMIKWITGNMELVANKKGKNSPAYRNLLIRLFVVQYFDYDQAYMLVSGLKTGHTPENTLLHLYSSNLMAAFAHKLLNFSDTDNPFYKKLNSLRNMVFDTDPTAIKEQIHYTEKTGEELRLFMLDYQDREKAILGIIEKTN